jgi:hypothetical protein
VGSATRRYRIFPSVLIIGAQRAGTTSLFDALARHPYVARPTTKEVHFFDDNFWRGTDWYRLFFPLRLSREYARRRGRDLIGLDATPSYLFHPAVPERVAATLPGAPLLVILRDPVDRAYSHYQHARRRNVERLSFSDAVAAEERRLAGERERLASDLRYRSTRFLHRSYISRGLYAEQLERWLAHFPRTQVHVVFAEEFFARPADVYAETIAFLGLPAWEPAEFPNSSPDSYPKLDETTRAGLAERFAAPNARLSRLLGRELPWDMPRQPGPTSPSTVASSL